MKRLCLAVVFELALMAIGFSVLPHPARAQSAVQCIGGVQGTNVAQFASSGSAIKVDKDQTVDLALVANTQIGAVSVEVTAGPWSSNVPVDAPAASRDQTQWAGQVVPSQITNLGIGLLKVNVTSTGGCDLSFWVDVTGGSPLSNPIGGASTIVLIGGVATQLFGVVRGLRRGRGLVWSLIGGIPAGLAACVLSQQLGLTPLTPTWAMVWTVPSVSIGGLLNTGASAFGRRSAEILIRPDDRMILHAPPPEAEGPPVEARAEPPPLEPEQPRFEAHAAPPEPEPEPETQVIEAHAGPPVGMDDAGDAGSGADDIDEARVRALPDAPVVHEAAAPPSPEPAAVTATATAEKDPPRTAYSLIECPEAVVAQTEFEATLGLSAAQVAGVAGPVLVRPESSHGAYTLTVQVVADGFSLSDGETWRHELPVTAEAAYPSFVLHLTAGAQDEEVRPRTIEAIYSVEGQSMGLAVRAVAVVKDAHLLDHAPKQTPPELGSMSIPTSENAADLTVRIQNGKSEDGGRLLWTFDSPHADIDVPDEAVATDIGSEPEKFARQLVDGVGVREGQLGLRAYLLGLGRTIADQMPQEFWDVLLATAKQASSHGRVPSVFILSEEPYVPWELAVVDPPLSSDASLPPFLGAQACVGRWVLGQRRPKLPPPTAVNVGSMAVVSGEYNQPGWNRLLEAEQEAATITQSYGATAVPATTKDVLQCLEGVPKADALHFAVHGIYDPNSVMNGIVLTDGQTLDPLEVKGNMLAASPFVFLNACQVGSANRILGDYGGMADAFLYAGASGVIAPLWSIKDTVAREIALRFYVEAFAGTPPAEIMRRERASFHGVDAGDSATCLAYIWYGHPSLKLSKVD
ncbi:MAG TPA: CHAT domain-containing protein [Dehalococcoidia bacterium]|nr:CHAT domain-containing protein [Dehalococcoidia bacterium]